MADNIEVALWVTWISGREYLVSILRSPHGLGTHRFVVPENSSLLTDLDAGPAEGERDLRRPVSRASQSPLLELREQGEELFRLVFAGENREPFKKCFDEAVANGAWLRLRLTFQKAPAAADWPWEAMVVEWTGQFLANMPRVSFERTIGLAQLAVKPPSALDGVLQMLIVSASPAGLTSIGAQKEKSKIVSVFKKAGIPIKVRVATSRETLDRATASNVPYDIVHLICHGDFEENEGGLWLEGGARGEGKRITSRELPVFLRGRPVKLVFLNACHSARGARDPFAGFAESLLRAGTAAVVAMRRQISDRGAIKLAPEFYGHIAAGGTVAHSLAKWRSDTSLRDDGDWAVPVLYLAGNDLRMCAPVLPSPSKYPETRQPEETERPHRPKRRVIFLAFLALLLILAGLALWGYLTLGLAEATTDLKDSGAVQTLFVEVPPAKPPMPAIEPRCPSPTGIDLPMVLIKAGRFEQGGKSGGESDERPVHPVQLTRDFCLAAFELTKGQYAGLMGASPVSADQEWMPQEDLDGNDPVWIIRRLNEREVGARFFLPTESQWEFAARAGLQGDEKDGLASPANCKGSSKADRFEGSARVGSFAPNAFGLYDMKGNLWEWVADWESKYSPGLQIDPRGPKHGDKRIRRGGSYLSVLKNCRISTREGVMTDRRQEAAGVRIAREPVVAPK